jgi:hypothetical protein
MENPHLCGGFSFGADKLDDWRIDIDKIRD